MNLIGRNKIADYILKHPQARIALLTFLKEFPYRHERYTDHSYVQVDGIFQTDGFDCLIKVRINHFAKAINILELTTAEEEMNKWEQKLKEQKTNGIEEEVTDKRFF